IPTNGDMPPSLNLSFDITRLYGVDTGPHFCYQTRKGHNEEVEVASRIKRLSASWNSVKVSISDYERLCSDSIR
ncbi:MAG: hypothetical protein MN733_34390, partial [Nitrososphaera sp.]|nr:hypothetical protein [Nitrososphaera sp.]